MHNTHARPDKRVCKLEIFYYHAIIIIHTKTVLTRKQMDSFNRWKCLQIIINWGAREGGKKGVRERGKKGGRERG